MEYYEKKYKDVLAKAREIHRNENEKRSDMEWLFPELKESEDEKVRKALVDALNKNLGNGIEKYGTTLNAALTWLEKQGSQQPTIIWHSVSEEPEEMKELFCEWESDDATWHDVAFYDEESKTFRHAKMPINVTKWVYVDELLEKQGEQKPADKPISKDEILYQLVQNGTITEFDYLYLTRRFNITEPTKDYQDIDPHFGIPADKVKSNLLTVERAKEISPFMRSGFENESADKVEPKKAEKLTELEDELSSLFVTAVHRYCRDKGLETPHFVGETLGDGMAKEWSSSILELAKKELKIEQKPAWSYEDEANLNNIIMLCNNCINGSETTWIPSQATKIKHLIETIKERGLLQQKPTEWSGEDENMLAIIIEEGYLTPSEKQWLKSLKDRIGG